MPAAGKDIVERLSDNWSISEKIDEIKGKLLIKNKNREAYEEASNREIKQNEKYITCLRKVNDQQRERLNHHANGDAIVIKTVFKDDHKEKLSLQSRTANSAIDEVNTRTAASSKELNNLYHERLKHQKLLQELAREYETLVFLEQKSPDQLQAEKTATQIENDVDKAYIKYETACNITRRYKAIFNRMKADSMMLPARLEAMEQALIDQKHELHEIQEMAKAAAQHREDTKRRLLHVENRSIDARRQRDSELAGFRKEVEKRRIENMYKPDKKMFGGTLLQEMQPVITDTEIEESRTRQKKILTYEEALQHIQKATHVNDISDVVIKVLTQQETAVKLQDRVIELELQKHKLTDEYENLKVDFHEIKYSGNRKLSKAQQLLGTTQDHVEREISRYEKILSQLRLSGDSLVNAKTGVDTLLDKLCDIKLPPPNFNYVKSGDVLEQLDLSSKKLLHLLLEIENEVEASQVTNDKFTTREFQHFLELRLPSDNARVKVQASESDIADYGYDKQENAHEFLTRKDIKNMCQKIIDSKEKRKRPKKSKKK